MLNPAEKYQQFLRLPESVRARRREVALILRRATEAGRFDHLVAPEFSHAWRPWDEIERTARELLGAEFDDVEIVPNLVSNGAAWQTHYKERVVWRVNGTDEALLLDQGDAP